MKDQDFIPDKNEPLDSDDSSINGDAVDAVVSPDQLSNIESNSEDEDVDFGSNYSDSGSSESSHEVKDDSDDSNDENVGFSDTKEKNPENVGFSDTKEKNPENVGFSDTKEKNPENVGLSDKKEKNPENVGFSDTKEKNPDNVGLSDKKEKNPENVGFSDTQEQNADNQKENDHQTEEKEEQSDCESTSSEEVDASMEDIFGVKPSIETRRNHPPNFKTQMPILDLCFHPETELLAAACIDGDCIIYRYSLENVDEVARLTHHKKSCRQLCFNENGTVLYTISKDKSIAVIDAEISVVKTHMKEAHEAPIYSFVEIDNNLSATGDDDGTVKLWDLRGPKQVMSFKCGEQTVTSLLTCEHKKYLSATVADGSLAGFNLNRTRLEAQSEMFSSEFTCQALVRGQSRLVVGSGSGILYIFNWGEFGYNIDGFSGHPDLVQCIVPVTDKMLITGCDDGNIRVIHLYQHKFLGIVGQHNDFGVENLAVSCEGMFLASCSLDEEIQFWNIDNLYEKKVSSKKSNKRSGLIRNLSSSKKRNPWEFFRDLPRIMPDSEDDVAAPSYFSD